MSLRLRYYTTARGVRPVADYIEGLARADQVFYVLLRQEEMVLLHAYRKQSQKAPARHLEMARQRMREVLR